MPVAAAWPHITDKIHMVLFPLGGFFHESTHEDFITIIVALIVSSDEPPA